MCKEDIRIGRSTVHQYQTASLDNNLTRIASADPARLTLIAIFETPPEDIGNTGNILVYFVQGGVYIPLMALSDTNPYAVASISTHGRSLTGEIWAKGVGPNQYDVTFNIVSLPVPLDEI